MLGFLHRIRTVLGAFLARQGVPLRLGDRVGIWYHPEYKSECLARTMRVPNVELDRGELVLGTLVRDGLVAGSNVFAPRPASLAELSLVHSIEWLEESGNPLRLARIFGVDPSDVDVDCVLRAQRRAVGGTVAAARWALRKVGRVGFNLGGGFHHAQPQEGAGFCVYNDVAVAIALLREDGFDAPIAIVDLDYHQGDGNLVTFAQDRTVLTYSIHGSVWSHVQAVADHQVLLPEGTGDAGYLVELRRSLPGLLEAHGARLVFYIAGNDVLHGDALGGFSLSLEGLVERDRFVVDTARRMGASLVVTLGGGYSSRAWRGSARFLSWLLTGTARPAGAEEDVRRHFSRIAATLDPSVLQGATGDLGISEAELMGDLFGRRTSQRLLGYYSVHGVEVALERYGLLQVLRDRGFSDLRLTVDPRDPERQRITLNGKKGHGPEHLLVDLILRLTRLPVPVAMDGQEELSLVSVEWLLLQDPTESFSLRRPPLPGQEHPGLGMVRQVMEVLLQVCRRLGLDGIVARPSAYHIAALGRNHCHFLDPRLEGRFAAMSEVLESLDFAEATRLVDEGALVTADGAPVRWEPGDIVAPASGRLAAWFESDVYREAAADAARRLREAGLRVAEAAAAPGAAPAPPLSDAGGRATGA